MRRCFCATATYLLLCCSLVAHAETGTQPAPVIRWNLPRGRIFIEPRKKLVLYLTVKNKSGEAIPNLELKLGASSGSLSRALHLKNGRYKTTYRMPDQRHPQAVILYVSSQGAPPVWTVLRLWSKVTLPVNTDKPNVRVRLKLDNRTYGPVTTDDAGYASVNLTIGPGEDHALAVAEDALGNRSKKSIPIPVPPTIGLVGLADRKMVTANGMDKAHIYLFAIHPNGRPVFRASFNKNCNQGHLSKIKTTGPGIYQTSYTAPAQMTNPTSEVVIKIKDRRAFDRIKLLFGLIRFEPPPPTPSPTPSPTPAIVKVDISPDQKPNPPSGLFSFGPSAGFITNFGRIQSISILFEGIIALPLAKPHLFLSLSLGYRFGSKTDRVGVENRTLETDLETIPVYASILYKMPLGDQLALFAAIGPGVEFVRWTLSRDPDIIGKGHAAQVGVFAKMGAEYQISERGTLIATLGYLYSYLNDSSPSDLAPELKGSRIKGNLGGLEILCGYRIRL